MSKYVCINLTKDTVESVETLDEVYNLKGQSPEDNIIAVSTWSNSIKHLKIINDDWGGFSVNCDEYNIYKDKIKYDKPLGIN